MSGCASPCALAGRFSLLDGGLTLRSPSPWPFSTSGAAHLGGGGRTRTSSLLTTSLQSSKQHRRHICAAASGLPSSSSSSGSDGVSSSRQHRRSKSGMRREDLPFFIARSDLTWAQPWRFQQAAGLGELQLRAQGLSALDDAAAAEEGRSATATFVVQLPSGLGALVVTGTVEAAVPLRCEFCGEAYEAAVAERFDGEPCKHRGLLCGDSQLRPARPKPCLLASSHTELLPWGIATCGATKTLLPPLPLPQA